MGMFDTFYGKIKCPICGEYHQFEEQTKDYDCVLADLELGDYIDKGNSTYIYKFQSYCEKEYKETKWFNGNIIIVKGQIVKFVNDDELKNIDTNKLKNIEDGLGRKLEYQERCKIGVGYNNESSIFGCTFENEKTNWNEHPKQIGDRLFALNNDWLITGTYKENLLEKKSDKCLGFYKIWFRENYVYKITNKLGDRIARVSKDCIELFYDNGYKTEWDSDNPNDYFIQSGCELIEI